MGDLHPESPARLQAIEDQLIASRIADYLDYREASAADDAVITRVHHVASLASVREHLPAETAGPGARYALDADTAINAFSLRAALCAAGAAVAATDAVMTGEVENAFCAIRPPGHHAMPSSPMGFCLFNNVAIAAAHALAAHGLNRIAIVDFDVHHGNGTEAAFRGDPHVLMVGFFQYPLYPYTGEETMPCSGGNMLNQPLPAYTCGDVVRQLVTEVWVPALHAFKPEMIFISAGFDAHREDDLGQMGLVEADYAWMTRQIMCVAAEHARGRIVSCLEGGYNLSALGRSAVSHIKALAQLD